MMPAGLVPYGWNALSAWLVTLAGVLCLAWVFAELARHLPEVGGSYGVMRLAVGERVAFLGAWGYIVSIWAANAAITVTGVSYLSRLVPVLSTNAALPPLVALSGIWLLTWVNLRGLRSAGRVQLVTTLVKLLPFASVIVLALWRLATAGTATLPPVSGESFSLAGTTGAGALTLYAMLGLESAAIPADAVEDPARVVPRATMVGTGFTAVVSLIATCAVVLMLPAATVLGSNAPIADFIAVSWGSAAGIAVAACAVVSCFGCLNGWLLVGGELPAAMADADTLPRWFGARNGAGAPAQSILVCSVMTSLLTLMALTRVGAGAYQFAALLSAATGLGVYVLSALAIFACMRRGLIPRGAALAACGSGALLFSLWALYGTGWESLAWGAVLIAAGWPLHLMSRAAPRVPP